MEFEDLIPESEWVSEDLDIDFDECRKGIIKTRNRDTLKYPESYFRPMDLFYDGENMNGIKNMIDGISVTYSKNKEGSCVIRGSKFQFVYNEPLPQGVTAEMLERCIKYLERLHTGLVSEFPKLALPNRITKVHLSGNATNVNVPPGIAALASADVLVMPPSVAQQMSRAELGTIKLMAHECGHVFFANFYPHNKEWGNGFGEIFADFACNFLFPTDSHVYNCMESIVVKNHNLNLFGLESLSYSTKPMRCYNGIFWVFYLARFGKENMQEFLSNQQFIFNVPKRRFWDIVADFNKISERELGAMWLADCMTMGMFKDDSVRWAAAKKALIGKVANKSMLWRNVHNRFLELNDSGDLESQKQLEAFGFMVFDIKQLVDAIFEEGDNVVTLRGPVAGGRKGKKKRKQGKLGKGKPGKGQPGTISVNPQVENNNTLSDPIGPLEITIRSADIATRKDDESTWVIVVVNNGVTKYVLSNSVIIDKLEGGDLLGVMHLKTYLMKNNASSESAINFAISIDEKI